ncbi:uncharacterized protein BDV17DRAFT_158733 [Aspergillus undulatus]|uniref:uncharacterized protein n=1 Tax=Aspergillus undulatus TaxID=1810928 RepID=UPI003CCD2A9C
MNGRKRKGWHSTGPIRGGTTWIPTPVTVKVGNPFPPANLTDRLTCFSCVSAKITITAQICLSSPNLGLLPSSTPVPIPGIFHPFVPPLTGLSKRSKIPSLWKTKIRNKIHDPGQGYLVPQCMVHYLKVCQSLFPYNLLPAASPRRYWVCCTPRSLVATHCN